jgi:hypothetical protein
MFLLPLHILFFFLAEIIPRYIYPLSPFLLHRITTIPESPPARIQTTLA